MNKVKQNKRLNVKKSKTFIIKYFDDQYSTITYIS